MEHIDNMQNLRESVSLRGYAQRDPLIEYKEQAFLMFRKLLSDIQVNTISTLFKIDLSQQLPPHLLKANQSPLENLQTNDTLIKENLNNAALHAQQQPAPSSSSGWAMPQSARDLHSGKPAAPAQTDEEGIRVIQADSSNSTSGLTCANLGRNDICPECGVKAKKCPKRNNNL
jgi:preprotein translocase subunit SecA